MDILRLVLQELGTRDTVALLGDDFLDELIEEADYRVATDIASHASGAKAKARARERVIATARTPSELLSATSQCSNDERSALLRKMEEYSGTEEEWRTFALHYGVCLAEDAPVAVIVIRKLAKFAVSFWDYREIRDYIRDFKVTALLPDILQYSEQKMVAMATETDHFLHLYYTALIKQGFEDKVDYWREQLIASISDFDGYYAVLKEAAESRGLAQRNPPNKDANDERIAKHNLHVKATECVIELVLAQMQALAPSLTPTWNQWHEKFRHSLQMHYDLSNSNKSSRDSYGDADFWQFALRQMVATAASTQEKNDTWESTVHLPYRDRPQDLLEQAFRNLLDALIADAVTVADVVAIIELHDNHTGITQLPEYQARITNKLNNCETNSDAWFKAKDTAKRHNLDTVAEYARKRGIEAAKSEADWKAVWYFSDDPADKALAESEIRQLTKTPQEWIKFWSPGDDALFDIVCDKLEAVKADLSTWLMLYKQSRDNTVRQIIGNKIRQAVAA